MTGRVQAFLDTQRALTSLYAAEGRDTSAAWSGSSVRREPTSPMLIPRATAAIPTTANNATSDKTGLPSSVQASPSSYSVDLPSNPVVNVPNRSKKSTRSQLKTGPKEVEPDESEHSERGSPTVFHIDGTHLTCAGLAQRRDRRRVKRSVTRAVEEESVPEVVHDSEHEVGESKKKRHKGKSLEEKSKSKRAKVSPALLLMQNFSAQNLGRSRLTVSLFI